MNMRNKIMGFSAKPHQYSSAGTRSLFSLDAFLGGAQGQEVNPPLQRMPGDSDENLESRFQSGVNRTDCPRMWGHASVDRRLANKMFSLSDDVFGWRRNGGEPIYKK